MGVHRITSEAAKYYALREKVIGNAISLIGEASVRLDKLSKEQLEKIGDLAAKLLPHAPGYAGKAIPIIARLFWKLAGVEEREFKFVSLEELETEVESLKKEIFQDCSK
ncbi:MAG: hypothetical protein NZ895_00205 [Archaeoglobaceae archaeon]|nr:hypothetical protein [Archaeoglobaceae archaeon]MCX8152339.1 hypothetical protein [Archaeoglobaceae archaeon]MDW8013633.1 hypothetical protein [Archaeoglobaceae archaeon]